MIDKLARNLFNELKSVLPGVTSDLPERELRSLLEGVLRKMNLVAREEFDAQQAVLMRTREKLEALEAQMNELEQQTETTKTDQ